jgi:hypothetical protein
VRVEPPWASSPNVQEASGASAVSGQRLPNVEPTVRLTAGGLPPLELGQEIDTRVVDKLADGRLLLEIAGTLVEANDPGSLLPGQRLRLQVDLIEPQLLLQIVDQELSLEAEVAKLLRRRLPLGEQDSLSALTAKIASVSTLEDGTAPLVRLEKLRNFLAALVNSTETMTADRLIQLVRDGGLHYEMKLLRAVAQSYGDFSEIADGDLKGLLLGALQELDIASVAGESRRAITGQLYHLEEQQAANLLAQLERHAFQLQIPVFTGAGFTDVALAIEADGKGSKQGKGKNRAGDNILFALDLQEFGRMRIDAHLKQDNLQVTFYIEVGTSLDLVRAELPQLRQSLQVMGFREVLLTARRLREMAPEQELKFTALSLGVPPDVQLLNVKV